MNVETFVQAKVVVPAVHRWPTAPDTVAHLRSPHRHLFVIRATKPVSHMDRDVEFQLLKADIEQWLAFHFNWFNREARDFGSWSCEQLATTLVETFLLSECSVHEDDENGAIVRQVQTP